MWMASCACGEPRTASRAASAMTALLRATAAQFRSGRLPTFRFAKKGQLNPRTWQATMVVADLVAGTFAGFGICAVGHPFDTLKVLLQTQPEKYRGMGDAFRQTVKAYGFGGLYRGVASPLVGMGMCVLAAALRAAAALLFFFCPHGAPRPGAARLRLTAARFLINAHHTPRPHHAASTRCSLRCLGGQRRWPRTMARR